MNRTHNWRLQETEKIEIVVSQRGRADVSFVPDASHSSHTVANGQAMAGAHPARWLYVSVGFGAALFFYLHLFRFPAVPIWHDGDQAIYLEHAERMLGGAVLYRDLFQFNMPGTEYLYYFLFRCLGLHLWIGHLAFLLAATAITLLVYSLSRIVLQGALAWLPAVAFLVICQRSSLDGSHHWYSALMVLCAVNIVARASAVTWIGLAGAFLGLATIFTSGEGAFLAAGIALFFIWEFRDWRRASKAIVALVVPFVTVVFSMMVYLTVTVGAKVLYYSLIVFPFRYYGAGYANDFSIYFDEWQDVFPLRPHSILLILLWFLLNAAVPIVLAVFMARCLCRNTPDLRNSDRTRALMLYAFAAVFALLAVARAPSAPRLNCAAVFAYILAVALLKEIGARRLIGGALALACAAALAEIVVAAVRPAPILDGARGPVAMFSQSDYQYTSWLAHIARPGDRLFGSPTYNFVLGLKNPSKLEWVEPDAYTRPEQVRELLDALNRYPTRFILFSDESGDQVDAGDNLKPFRAYLREHYRFVHPADMYGGIFVEDTDLPNDVAARE
ncbi:MAG: hypothetical protein ABSB50_03890 [Terracidiphilus sp.]|jgi:hypothetical protein